MALRIRRQPLPWRSDVFIRSRACAHSSRRRFSLESNCDAEATSSLFKRLEHAVESNLFLKACFLISLLDEKRSTIRKVASQHAALDPKRFHPPPSRNTWSGRSGSDPPPEGGCPRCLHEFSCSGTTQHMGSRPHQRLKYKLPAARCLGMPSHQTRSPATLPS